jgi:hypothetical protein
VGQGIGNRSAGGGIGIYCDQLPRLFVGWNQMEGNGIGLVGSNSAPQVARKVFLDNRIALQVEGEQVRAKVELNVVRAGELLLRNNTASEVVRRLWQQPAQPGRFALTWDGTDE